MNITDKILRLTVHVEEPKEVEQVFLSSGWAK